MQAAQITEQPYEVTDFPLACFLRAIGYQIAGVRAGVGSRRFFLFEDGPERKRDVSKFYAGTALVDPSEFSRVIKDLKAMLADS